MAGKLPLIEGSGAGPSWLGTSRVSRCGVLTQRALSSLPKRCHLHSQPLGSHCGPCWVPAPPGPPPTSPSQCPGVHPLSPPSQKPGSQTYLSSAIRSINSTSPSAFPSSSQGWGPSWGTRQLSSGRIPSSLWQGPPSSLWLGPPSSLWLGDRKSVV